MNPNGRVIRSLYAQIPDVNCKGLCQESCGPIEMSKTERRLIGVTVTHDPKTLTCNQLDEGGRCSIYEDRPLVCRLWGAVPEMSCPFGCEPTLTSEEGHALMRGMFRIP